jgi:capsular polysaccharide biosynthesis protein
VDLRIAARAMVVAVVLAAVGVASASYLQTPTYEASAQVLVDWEQEGPWKTLEYREPPTQEFMHTIGIRSVAQDATQRLGLQMDPDELLDNLSVEQLEGTSFIVLTYEDTNPVRAQRIVNTVSEVSSELISERSRNLRATVFEKAARPESPASPRPLRNGTLALVIGLALCVVGFVATPATRRRVAGGERIPRQRLATWYSDHSIVERVNEKKLLQALGRRGKLTAIEAALESELAVEEANRILEELAFAGHLEVTVEHGRLLYSFWEHGA